MSSDDSDDILTNSSYVTENEEIKRADISKYDFDMNLFFKSKKELMFYKMINNFFKQCKKEDIEKMVTIITKSEPISLRLLDWFITKYSKKTIGIEIGGEKQTFDVHISYKAQLRSFKKRQFDPFKRAEPRKFNYYYDKNDKEKKVTTTLAQLNFFKWSITNGILIYVEKNLAQINKEMSNSNEDKKKKDRKDKRKLKDKNVVKLSTTKTVDVRNDQVELIISFD
jgi:hypothetical protein